MTGMTHNEAIEKQAGARDAALTRMNRLTAGVVFAAVAGVGVAGYAAAATFPGKTTTTTASTSGSSSSTPSSSSTSSGLQSSSSSVSSSSTSGVAVSGGSR